MSDIKVKDNKIKTHKGEKYFSLVLIGIALLLIATFLVVTYRTFVTHDIYVKYGKDTYKTTSDATVGAVFAQINDGSVAPGNLVSVVGSVIETGTGGPIVYSINDKVVAPTTFLKSGDKITATSGQNKIEKTLTTTIEGHLGYHRRGMGPIITIATPGKNPITSVVTGEKSKAVKSSTVTQAGAKPVAVYRTYNNEADKVVALTFDDGPSATYTPKILAVLKKHNVKATFFELGSEIKKHPQLTQQVAAAGNQVALHSEKHIRLAHATVADIRTNVTQGKETIKQVLGVYPTYMRPPYGSVDGAVYNVIQENGLGIALWSIDTRDWSRPGVKHIVDVANKYRSPGVIILMHDGGGNRQQTVDALPKIIKAYKKAGYRFVTIDEYGKLLNGGR